MFHKVHYDGANFKIRHDGDPKIGSFLENIITHANGQIDRRIAGKNATIAKPVYTTQNHNTSTYVRNTSNWLYDIGQQLTAASPWNSYNANNRSGTLISPRHAILAAHYNYPVGTTLRFVDINNNVITRTVSAANNHPLYSPYYPDICVVKLDSDVPDSISFVKVLPSNWASYFFRLSALNSVATFGLDGQERAIIRNWILVASNYIYYTTPSSLTKRYEFFESLIAGDSGDPSFVIINSELVLLNTWTYSNGMSTFLPPHYNAINTIMTNQGGGYQLTYADLSNFATG